MNFHFWPPNFLFLQSAKYTLNFLKLLLKHLLEDPNFFSSSCFFTPYSEVVWRVNCKEAFNIRATPDQQPPSPKTWPTNCPSLAHSLALCLKCNSNSLQVLNFFLESVNLNIQQVSFLLYWKSLAKKRISIFIRWSNFGGFIT